MKLIELHRVVWGPILPSSADPCERLTDRIFCVTVELTRPANNSYWVTGAGDPPRPHEIPQDEPLFLNKIPGTVLAIGDRHESDIPSWHVTVQVELKSPMPVVAFSPNPDLAVDGGISFEDALRLAWPEGSAIINWISEDAAAWYFNGFSFAGSGATRIAKRDGHVSYVDHTMPIPGYVARH
jgi:hypothetical protein